MLVYSGRLVSTRYNEAKEKSNLPTGVSSPREKLSISPLDRNSGGRFICPEHFAENK